MATPTGRTGATSGRDGRNARAADRRQETPRRVRHGIRLRTEPEDLRRSAVPDRWLRILEGNVAIATLHEGLEYARAGQIAQLAVGGGVVDAVVQGRAAQPYDTQLRIDPLPPEQWTRLVATLAGDAGVVARLLTGEMPEGLLEISEQGGAALLPPATATFAATCTCGLPAPCKHAAAAGYVLAERLERQPLTVFDLRGLAADRLLERLRQVRAMQAYGAVSAHVDPLIPESQVPAPPLESTLEDFWRAGPHLQTLTRQPPAEYAPQALLRRLGPSPLPGRFPLVGLLASIYDTVADHALRVRDHAEQIE